MAVPEIKVKVGADTQQGISAINQVIQNLDRLKVASNNAGWGVTNLGAQFAKFSRAAPQAAKASMNFGSGIQNASFQVADFAVQVGMGTSAVRALSMQLPQLLGGFGVFGAVAGGVVAVLGALISNMAGADEGAKRFGETLSKLRESTQSMRNELDLLRSGFESIEELRVQEELNRLLQERARLQNAIEATGGTRLAQDFQYQLDVLNKQIEPLQAALDKHRQTKEQLALSKQAASDLYNSIIGIAQADLSRLIGQAEVLGNRFATAAQNAYAMAEAAMMRIQRGNQVGRGRGTSDPRTMGGSAADWQKNNPSAQLAASYGAAFTNTVSMGGGGAGGGGAASGNPALESLIQQLQTEREILDEWYSESLERLQSANERELEVLGGHKEAKLRLEQEYAERLSRIQKSTNKSQLDETLSGGQQILSALGQTNEKALKISQAFAAAEALISTLRGAAKELEKGVIGIGTAATVVAKGIGFVSAIRGVNASSGGSFGGAGGFGFAGGAAAATAPPPPVNEQFYNVNLTGEGPIGRDGVRGLINQLNEAIEDGAVLKGIVVTG